MRFKNNDVLEFRKDGGQESYVYGWFILAIKRLFSIVLLRFEPGSREAYHSHAFNCVSWVLCGNLVEHHLNGTIEHHRPSIRPFMTYRDTFHKVVSVGRTYVLTLRGPWAPTWCEYVPGVGTLRLAWGRRVVG